MKIFNIIVATDEEFGIGKDGKIPWYISSDLKNFRKITINSKENKQNAVIMGSNTWYSIGSKYRPLVNRMNIVVTAKKSDFFGVHTSVNLLSALEMAYYTPNIDKIFIIGGSNIYEDALFLLKMENEWKLDNIFLTTVLGKYQCDKFFPKNLLDLCRIEDSSPVEIENGFSYISNIYKYYQLQEICEKQEERYLHLLKKVMISGICKSNRTGIDSISKFGEKLTFNLRGGVFPLLTTKKMFTRGIIEELLWFLRGQTDVNILKEKSVHIWDGNSTREYLDSVGLKHLNDGDIGPGYGFQWKHFGAEYFNCKTNYKGEGTDQIKYIQELLRTNQDSRRIILSAWNPEKLNEMALPPCHVLYQFYTNRDELSMNVYLRSNDLFLGCPFNIASSALFLYMIGSTCNYKIADLNLFIGDAHIYTNHISQVREQLSRIPNIFPTIEIKRIPNDITEFEVSDFNIINYNCHKPIKAEMAV